MTRTLLLLAGLAPAFLWAADRPASDVNGLLHTYQAPVLFAEDSDTLVSGWAGPAAITVPDMAAARASCVAGGASGTFGSGDYIIKDDAGILELEKSTLLYGDYYICPGDYLSAASGTINTADSGTARTDAGVVKVMCVAPTAAGQKQNPWQRNASPDGAHAWATSHDGAVECIIPKIDAGGEDYWFLHNVTIHRSANAQGNCIDMDSGASNWIVDRVWADASRLIPPTTSTGATCIRVWDSGADDNIIQNSAIGPQAPVYELEAIGVGIGHGVDRVYLSNNRVWNLGQNIQSGTNTAGGTGEGSAIVNNDVFPPVGATLSTLGETESEWTSRGIVRASSATSISQRIFDPAGTHSVLFDTGGRMTCGQGTILIKHGSNNPANPMRVMHNRVWNTTGNTVRCNGDNTSSSGSVTYFQHNPENTVVENNVAFNVHGQINGVGWTDESGAQYDGLVVRQNVLHQHPTRDFSDKSWEVSLTQGDFTCNSPCSGMAKGITYEFNTFSVPGVAANYHADPFNKNHNKSYWTFNCNVIHGANSTGTAPGGTQNINIDGTVYSSLTSTVDTTAVTANLGDFTFYYDLQQSTPPQFTIPDVIPPEGIGWEDHCTQTAPATDITGVTRQASTTPGAFVAGALASPPTGYLPQPWNGTRTSVLRDRVVILPAEEAAGIACDPATYNDLDWDGTTTSGTYDCITSIPTTGHLIQATDSFATLESEINDSANGNVFLLDVTGDWSTGGRLEITRTDTDDTDPLWLLPSDIATRTEGPWITSSAKLPFTVLICDGANANLGVDGFRAIGLEFTAPGQAELFNSGYPGTCADDQASEDMILSHNYFHDWGVSTAGNGAVYLRGTGITFTNNHIRNWQNWYSVTNQNQDMDAIRIRSTDGPVYIARNYSRDISGDHVVVTPDGSTRRRFAIEHNTWEWGPESFMDGDGSSGVLPTLNPNGLYQGGENCLDIKAGSNASTSNGGWVRGNVCIGQRQNNDNGGSSGGGGSAAIDVSWSTTEDIRIHGNFLVDVHTRGIAESNNAAENIDFTGNVVELNPAGRGETAYQSYEQGGVFARFSDSRIAFNTFVCTAPGISWLVTQNGTVNDIKYNVAIDCDAADTNNRSSTACTDCAVENILRNTLAGTADDNETIDNDAGTYLDFGFYLDHPHFADAGVTGNVSPRIYTLYGVVPPSGGTAATAVPSPAFTGSYGTVYPVHRWYNQVP